MDKTDQLANQHIREHEAKLKHIDELLSRLDEKQEQLSPQSEIEKQLLEVRNEREKLFEHIAELKKKSRDEWQVEEIEQVGPMIIWDAVAKKLEKLVERIGH